MAAVIAATAIAAIAVAIATHQTAPIERRKLPIATTHHREHHRQSTCLRHPIKPTSNKHRPAQMEIPQCQKTIVSILPQCSKMSSQPLAPNKNCCCPNFKNLVRWSIPVGKKKLCLLYSFTLPSLLISSQTRVLATLPSAQASLRFFEANSTWRYPRPSIPPSRRTLDGTT